MLERIWTNLLELTAQFVTPDWGKIIAFLPVLFVVIVVALLLWVFRRLIKAPPARRGKKRISSKTPAGVHMPGPSWRPFLGAVGVFLLLLGLVFDGWLLAVGVIALIATLVGWLTDAVQEYRRTVDADRTGHLESGPAPGTPSRLLAALTI